MFWGWESWVEVFTLSSLLCDLYSILKGRRAAALPGLSDLSHSHHTPARRANRSASLLKCPLSPPPPLTSPSLTLQTRPLPRLPIIGLAGLPGLFHSVCFFESWFLFFCFFGFVLLFLPVMWCFSFYVYNDEGDKALSPKLLHKPFWMTPIPQSERAASGWGASGGATWGWWGDSGAQMGGCLNWEGNYLRWGICWKPGSSSSCFRTV